MEAMALCDCKKKEDIPPSSSKHTNPVLGITPSSTKTTRRRFRKPLADITNLFNSAPQSASASSPSSHSVFQLPTSAAVSAPNPRKRKAVDEDDSLQCALFKTLRRDFR